MSCSSSGESTLLLHTDLDTLCHPPASTLHHIDVVNIVMGLLLALVLLDLSYNCYQYRRHGKLPWVVRKCV